MSSQYSRKTILALLTLALLTTLILQAGTFTQSFAAKSKTKTTVLTEEKVSNTGTIKIDKVQFNAKKSASTVKGKFLVELLQNGQTLAADSIAGGGLSKKKAKTLNADFDGLEVSGDYIVKLSFVGKGEVRVSGLSVVMATTSNILPPAGAPTILPPPPPPPPTLGKITVAAYRISSPYWAPTFSEVPATMKILLYDSAGNFAEIYANENGATFTGLQAGATYYVTPLDCNHCHSDPHDVVFNHWEDGSTIKQRPVTATLDGSASVSAYYEYIPPAETTTP